MPSCNYCKIKTAVLGYCATMEDAESLPDFYVCDKKKDSTFSHYLNKMKGGFDAEEEEPMAATHSSPPPCFRSQFKSHYMIGLRFFEAVAVGFVIAIPLFVLGMLFVHNFALCYLYRMQVRAEKLAGTYKAPAWGCGWRRRGGFCGRRRNWCQR